MPRILWFEPEDEPLVLSRGLSRVEFVVLTQSVGRAYPEALSVEYDVDAEAFRRDSGEVVAREDIVTWGVWR